MTTIKRLTVAAGLGAALALAIAGPAAAGGSHHDDDSRGGDVMFIFGKDQYCNAQGGYLVLIDDSCNGNNNKDSDGNGDVEN